MNASTMLRSPQPRAVALATAALLVAMFAHAQSPATPSGRAPPGYQPATPEGPAPDAEPSAQPADAGPLAPLEWLAGCWQGTVNQREFREQWLPLRGGMLIGAGQQVSRGRMQDYEFLRIESRADAIVFSQFSGDRNEIAFKLASTTTEGKDTIFTFANLADAFPARLVYRRGADGWLYETIEGTLDGKERRVIYPLRRIDCESGELILK
jgi:uncharacterized protein DUF6265